VVFSSDGSAGSSVAGVVGTGSSFSTSSPSISFPDDSAVSAVPDLSDDASSDPSIAGVVVTGSSSFSILVLFFLFLLFLFCTLLLRSLMFHLNGYSCFLLGIYSLLLWLLL